jgi:shikimate kinase
MRRKNSNIFLVGPMGSGKTTLGRRVAQALGLEFLDCDLELEELTGVSVNLIFDIEGEAGFRERETRMLRAMTARDGVLIATGGGAVLSRVNRDLLRANGFVVWLKTSVGQQLKRLGQDKARPLLQTPDREERLRTLARLRDPLYAELADLVFESSDLKVQIVAEQMLAAIRKEWRPNPEDQRDADG